MTVPVDILGFLKTHASDHVLSVYIDSAMTDPARRHAWRTVLREGIHRARARVEQSAPDALDAFERAVAAVEARLPSGDDAPVRPGWMLLCAESGELIEARLPVAPTALVAWQAGPVLFPYLVATRADDAVIALVDLDHARIMRLHRGVVHPVETLDADTSVEVEAHMGDTPRAGFHTGTRGETQTDAAQRQLREAHERLLTAARRQLAVIAGHDARVVVGGAAGATAHFLATLPAELASRTVVAESLHMTTPLGDIPPLVHAALTDLLSRRQQETLASLERRAHLTRHAAFGYDAVIAASAARAVEHVLISETLWNARPVAVEALTHDVLRAGAQVAIATPDFAGTLDSVGGGIAAELRFAVSTPTVAATVGA